MIKSIEKKLVVKSSSETDLILDKVHDRFFPLSDIKFCPDSRKLIFPITVLDNEPVLEVKGLFRKKWVSNLFRATLTVSNVESYDVVDGADIDRCDLSSITYNNNDGKLVFKSCLPVEIKIYVKKLELTLDVDVEPCGKEEY